VKDPYSTVHCSYNARSIREELDEERMVLSMTVDEINIMERWGQAARGRRQKRVKV
jgi:hypothetical protein